MISRHHATQCSWVVAAAAFGLTGCQAPAEDPPPASSEDSAKASQNGHTGMRPGQPKPNEFWWPEQVDLDPLRQNELRSNPHGDEFDYRAAFEKLDVEQLKKDMAQLLVTEQSWWPADFGTYGPFFIRLSWHAAGTYRVSDGRGGAGGGQQRFAPLNSWPDNANLDKARRLLWPLKKKYGEAVSWADLIVLAGTVAMDEMGFDTLGFGFGREDDWQPELVYWGPEKKMLADQRYHGDRDLKHGLAAVQMGLIYVNPEGPNGEPDPMKAAKDIRTTFGRMAMNDEETVALIAGGHTFGKSHGAHRVDACLEEAPAGAPVEQQGLGWKNNCGKGHSEDTITSGLEGAWTSNPNQWTHQYLANLYNFEWEKEESPAGATQWKPSAEGAETLVPDAHTDERHAPMMFTTDLALKTDPSYRKITMRWKDNPEEFEEAFAKAWFKLTHRDMGPKVRYLGPDVPEEDFLWQDPLPKAEGKPIDGRDVAKLKAMILDTDLTVTELVETAWASAASYRDSDMRGGANGARVRLAPQNGWAANEPAQLKKVLEKLEEVRKKFNDSARGGKRVSLADVIVLGGAAAIEKAASDAGMASVEVPFAPGRVDATQEQTDVDSFAHLEPTADGFRNYWKGDDRGRSPTDMLIDKADLLDLTVPEMTALVGGMRALNANTGDAKHGVFTEQPGTLTNDFFVNLLDMNTKWGPSKEDPMVYEGKDRKTGKRKWTATEVDLVFGSNAELRAVAEVYAYDREEFVNDFVAAWVKVMQADRFDLHR